MDWNDGIDGHMDRWLHSDQNARPLRVMTCAVCGQEKPIAEVIRRRPFVTVSGATVLLPCCIACDEQQTRALAV